MSAPPARIAAHVDVTAIEGHGLVVLLPNGHEIFAGPQYVAVFRAVDGARSDDEIVQASAPETAEADARAAVAQLRSAGVLVDTEGGVDRAEAAYWSQEGRSAREVADRLVAATVSIAVAGDVDERPVRDAIASAGVRVAPDGELLVVLTDDYLRPAIAGHNADALESGRPWMLAAPAAAELWLGPVFVPDRGACWECLAQRLRRHRSIESYLRDSAGRELPIVRGGGSLPATRAVAAGMLAAHVVRSLVLGRRAHQDQLLTVDPRTWQVTRHTLTRRPQCPACGFPATTHDRPAAPVTDAAADGGRRGGRELRAVAPETTIERFAHHVSPITGAVSRLVRVAGARPPRHVYHAGGPGPRIHGEHDHWSPGMTTMAGGKGTTDLQARASALCEALERYSGEFQGDEHRRSGSLEGLAPAALHPNACMNFSDAQYARRETLNAGRRSFRTFVPAPLDPAATVDWTPLWSLTYERERLLPTAYCFYSAHVPGSDACIADSNGNAAGNTLDEAILHGLLELVERDHVAVWWYNRLQRPGVALDALADPWLDDVRGRLEQEGRHLWALDLTADLGIPVVVAVAAPARGTGAMTFGYGAHLDLRLATVRAVSELVQLGSGAPSGGAGHGPQADVADSAYLRPADDIAPRSTGEGHTPITGDLRADLDACRRLIESAGLEVLVLDQTRPDIGLPVAKVVVPGMRLFWPRFGPGRLYDVPVALGDLAEPLCESQLNPKPPVT